MRGKVDDLIAGLVGFVSALGPVQKYVSLNRIIKKVYKFIDKGDCQVEYNSPYTFTHTILSYLF